MSLARLAARAQIALSIIFIAGYFVVLGLFLFGIIKTPPTWKDALVTLLGVITGGVMTIIGYWFSRQRPNDQEPPKE